jgi:hypothetical protein
MCPLFSKLKTGIIFQEKNKKKIKLINESPHDINLAKPQMLE